MRYILLDIFDHLPKKQNTTKNRTSKKHQSTINNQFNIQMGTQKNTTKKRSNQNTSS